MKKFKTLKEITKQYFPKHFEKKYKECIKCGEKLILGTCVNCMMKKIFKKEE